jgi:DNA-binding XRE family transcriptional regulator
MVIKKRGLPGLRQARLKSGLTQAQLEASIAASSGSVQRWEQGERDPSVWATLALAEALNTTVEEIAGVNMPAPTAEQ